MRMRTAAKLLRLMVLAPPLLVGLSIGFVALAVGKEDRL